MHSNASYLMAPKGWSHAAGYCFSSSQPTTPQDTAPPNNGPIYVLYQIMQQVVACATEAELGALFLNAQAICPLCIALNEMGHLQPVIPMQIDNSTACSIINDTIKQKCSKVINICFYRANFASSGDLAGSTNCANYFLKHHLASHHQAMCPT